MSSNALTVRPMSGDADVMAAFPLMQQLRPTLVADAFLAMVRLQERDGYRLVGGYDDSGRLACLAGYRLARTLSRGPHLFVDDLVTDLACRGQGKGTAMLAWLGGVAVEAGLAEVWLDSRASATGFYAQIGFELKRSVPCVVAAATLIDLETR